MSKHIESVAGNSGQILIEVSEAGGKVGFGVQAGEDKKKAENAFNQGLKTIRLAANSLLETLDTLEERPDTVRVDFAIKFDAEGRAMIANPGGDAQLRVSLGWNTQQGEEEKKDD